MKIDFSLENFITIGLMAVLAFIVLEAMGYVVLKSGFLGSTTKEA